MAAEYGYETMKKKFRNVFRNVWQTINLYNTGKN